MKTATKHLLFALSLCFTSWTWADQSAGLELYQTACQQCHGPNALGNQTLSAPRLAGQQHSYLNEQLSLFKSGKRGTHPDDLNGRLMSTIAAGLDTKQIHEVSRYLASLPSRSIPSLEANQHQGGALYQTTCAACHGQRAKGSTALFTPNLAILSDWYLKAQFRAYTEGWRGNSHSGSTRGKAMRSVMAQVSAKEQENLLSYLMQGQTH